MFGTYFGLSGNTRADISTAGMDLVSKKVTSNHIYWIKSRRDYKETEDNKMGEDFGAYRISSQ